MTLKLLQMQRVLSHVYMRSLWYISCLSIFYISFFTTNGKFQSFFQSRNLVASVTNRNEVLVFSFCMKTFL